MKISVEFKATIIDEFPEAKPKDVHTPEEIRDGIIETLKWVCTENGKVMIDNLNINTWE